MFIVFDIETTGFDSVHCEVLQFAYIMFDDNNQFVKSENLYFYHEGMHWSQEAADESHKLSLSFLKQFEDQFRPNLLKMFSVLNRANVCGHNSNSFDCPFVKRWLQRQGLGGLEFGIMQDTMLGFRPITKRSRIKLTKLADMCGLSDETIKYATSIWFNVGNDTYAHNAAYDVAMTALITLNGINRGLIKFDFTNLTSTEDDNDVVLESLLDEETSGPSKEPDPYGYCVDIDDGDGDTIYYWVNHDKHKYGDLQLTKSEVEHYASVNRHLPVKFKHSHDYPGGSVWHAEHNGIKFILDRHNDGDTMRVQTLYLDMLDTELDLFKIIENTFK